MFSGGVSSKRQKQASKQASSKLEQLTELYRRVQVSHGKLVVEELQVGQ
jgi:hypothetical protein